MPGTANSVVLGSRSTLAPKMTAVRRDRLQAGFQPCRASAPCARRRPPAAAAAAAAAPNPAIAATFSVPARKERSCPPPLISGAAIWMSPRRMSAPAPCGPPSLCEETVMQVGAEPLPMSQSMRPGALHRIDVQQPARGVHDLGDLGDGLDHAGLVVGEHDRNQRTLGPRKGCSQRIADRQFPSESTGKTSTCSAGKTARRTAPKGARWPKRKACHANALRRALRAPASAPAYWLRWRRR